MTTTRGNFAKRGIAAVAVGLLGAASFSSAAFADPDLSPSNITGTTGSLTIHKYDGNPGSAGDGTRITDTEDIAALGNALDGVEFTVVRVGDTGGPFDLADPGDWDKAVGVYEDGDSYTLHPSADTADDTFTTGTNGTVTISDLPYGLYLVTETDSGDHPVVSMVDSFFVTIPFADTANSEWIYDVHVYPKNKLNTATPTKTVSDPTGVEIGADVTWTVTAPVTVLAVGDTYTSFTITDTFDSRLDYKSVVVSYDGTPLDPTTDYSVTVDGQKVTIELTGALDDLEAGKDVVAVYTTTVTSLGDGEISNTAFVNVNKSKHDQQTDSPQSNWGPLKIVKVALEDEDKTLAGAEFTLHSSKTGDALTPPGTLTTDENGEIYLELWVGNDTDITETYWLKEVKAPAGYVLPTGDDVWTEITVTAGAADSVTAVQVNNIQQKAPDLPLTGSAGSVLLTIGGVAFVLIAAGVAVVTNRRKNALN